MCIESHAETDVQSAASSNSVRGRDIVYTLPPLVESVRTSWITTFQSAAVVSSLLAAVAGGLFFLYIASFGAIIFNISATMTSLVLMNPSVLKEGEIMNFDRVALLSMFGVHQIWSYFIWHWLLSLILGMWCILFEIIVFVWVSQKTTTAARATMTCAMVFTAIPLVIIQFLPIKSMFEALRRPAT
ncbi:hypothetical protein CPB85DRAFT_1274105 [Mucidula mucida]|nr:hypothetical protein CPB85DRAFT_1274105 [Mucidula mucida]